LLEISKPIDAEVRADVDTASADACISVNAVCTP
jgi:hypothetical protein